MQSCHHSKQKLPWILMVWRNLFLHGTSTCLHWWCRASSSNPPKSVLKMNGRLCPGTNGTICSKTSCTTIGITSVTDITSACANVYTVNAMSRHANRCRVGAVFGVLWGVLWGVSCLIHTTFAVSNGCLKTFYSHTAHALPTHPHIAHHTPPHHLNVSNFLFLWFPTVDFFRLVLGTQPRIRLRDQSLDWRSHLEPRVPWKHGAHVPPPWSTITPQLDPLQNLVAAVMQVLPLCGGNFLAHAGAACQW